MNMQLVAPLQSLRLSIERAASVERDLGLLSIDAASDASEVDEELQRRCWKLLHELKDMLRHQLAITAFAEAMLVSGVTRYSDVTERAAEIIAAADRAAGFAIMEFFPTPPDHTPTPPIDASSEFLPSKIIDAFVKHMLPRLRSIPLDSLTAVANMCKLPELAHECRVLYERLNGLLQRLAPEANVALNELGRLYLSGRVEISSVAKILGRPAEDVVVEFERLGFVRGLEQISLSADARNERLAEISRRGRVVKPSRELVRREAIASQRIENIDARMHLLDKG